MSLIDSLLFRILSCLASVRGFYDKCPFLCNSIFLKNKAKTLEEIFNNAKYIINDEVNFNEDDLKLIDDKSKKIINEFQNEIKNLRNLTRDNLEPIVNNLIKKHETNFKGVGQPLRVALTGSKFGPGLYDIVISLGKADVEKRLGKILN